MFHFDPRAIAVLNRINQAGHEAYLVGGCVRNALQNVAIQDYDTATSALPEEMLQIFSAVPVIKTGIRHGTVTVVWEGLPVEVTTFRVDGDYSDGRHPDQVKFTRSLREDLARRDFTVNAMAWSPQLGIVDPLGGNGDLEAKTLRCVGDPIRRFREDGLRILRGLRFSSTLEFSLESSTQTALHSEKQMLSAVSPERIREELTKLLCGRGVLNVLSWFPDVLGVFLPELLPTVGFDQKNFHHVYPLYEHLVHTVAHVPPLPHLRLAALLHDLGKPATASVDDAGVGHYYGHAQKSAEIADEIMTRLRYSNADRNRVLPLILHHDGPIEATPAAVRRKMNKLGVEGFFDLIALMRADNLALSPHVHYRQSHYDALEALAREFLTEKSCFSLQHLAINGTDLLELGIRGKEIGAVLQFLLDAVIEDKTENTKQSLLSYWKKNKGVIT